MLDFVALDKMISKKENPYSEECDQTKAKCDELLTDYNKLLENHIKLEEKINKLSDKIKNRRKLVLDNYPKEKYEELKSYFIIFDVPTDLLDCAVTRSKSFEEIATRLSRTIARSDAFQHQVKEPKIKIERFHNAMQHAEANQQAAYLLSHYLAHKCVESEIAFYNAAKLHLQGSKGAKKFSNWELKKQENILKSLREVLDSVPQFFRASVGLDVLEDFIEKTTTLVKWEYELLPKVESLVKQINENKVKEKKIMSKIESAKAAWREAVKQYNRYEKWSKYYNYKDVIKAASVARAQAEGLKGFVKKHVEEEEIPKLETQIRECESSIAICDKYLDKLPVSNFYYFATINILRSILKLVNGWDKARDDFKVRQYEVETKDGTIIPDKYDVLVTIKSRILDECKVEESGNGNKYKKCRQMEKNKFWNILDKVCEIGYDEKDVPELMRAMSAITAMDISHIDRKKEIEDKLPGLRANLWRLKKYVEN